MIYYIIPARKGSKGLIYKNRMLFDDTALIIPKHLKSQVIVTTDDDYIKNKAIEYDFLWMTRSESLSNDTASTRDVLINIKKKMAFKEHDIFFLLYLTYPERTWHQVQDFIDDFLQSHKKSMMCKKEIKHHPYLCLYEKEEHKGQQIVSHDLYRRQDYPKMFEISHFMFMCYISELERLNKNLYNSETVFYPIPDPIDIDTKKDLYDQSTRSTD